MPNGNKAVGRKLKEAREALGLSQDDVGEMLHMSGVNYGNFERGKRAINCDYLIQLSGILSRPASWFLGEEGDLSSDEEMLVRLYRAIKDDAIKSFILNAAKDAPKK